MARKKNAEAAESQPESQTTGTGPQTASRGNETNGTEQREEKKGPLKCLSYQIGHDTFVQASIWERTVQRKDGGEFTTYDVSLRKRYKDPSGGWKSSYSFHASELFAALQAAAYTICELRAANCPF